MEQYTTPEQTSKLIELGFEKPKMAAPALKWVDGEPTFEPQYTISELLSFLPLTIQWTPRVIRCNVIEYSFETEGSELYYCNAHNELIDNLFAMIVKLKEEGVI